MKRLHKKVRGLIRGTPGAVLFSALVHIVLLSVAGGVVVFQVIKKQEKKFVPPPPVERPKKPLQMPQVKIKRNIKPGGIQRIVSQAFQGVPELQLPAVEGIGEGLGGDIGGFEMMPDSSSLSMFGGTKSLATGNDFEGTFYSLRYDRQMKVAMDDKEDFLPVIRQFFEYKWNDRVFAPYYRAPQKLYATQFMVPGVISSQGPEAFGIENEMDFDPILWVVHYKGRISSKSGGRFRFWGTGDLLFVRFNGEMVFAGGLWEDRNALTDWPEYLNDEEKEEYNLGTFYANVGKWFELEPGVPVDMEILTGEGAGYYFTSMLMIEKEGEIYARNREGMPILPVFRTAEISESVKNQIKYKLIDGEVDLDAREMFNVY